MLYKKSNLYIDSDLEIRTIREDGIDIDILIPVENRTLNLYLDNLPDYIKSRFQFSMVKNMIIRFCTLNDNNTCTIHLLRSIDLHSSVLNLEIDYTNHYFEIKDNNYYLDIYVKKKDISNEE